MAALRAPGLELLMVGTALGSGELSVGRGAAGQWLMLQDQVVPGGWATLVFLVSTSKEPCKEVAKNAGGLI